MKVYRHLDDFIEVPNPIVTTGTFDGLHIGHRKIIHRIKELALEKEGENVILTFFPHPRMVLHPDDHDLKLLNTLDEKVKLFQEAGVNHLIIQPFTKEFSRTTSTEFVRDILVDKLKVNTLVIGYDHHFGRNREGSMENLQELKSLYNFQLEEIAAQDIDDINISSTKIRNALAAGEVDIANQYLGYEYFISGTVVEGEKIGSQIGFPTANIYIEEKYKLIPSNGVYAVRIGLGERNFSGMLNIGMRPTVNGKKRSIEVHIFDFDEEIYESPINVSLVKMIREEIKFESLEDLKKQLFLDRNKALNILM